VRETQPMKFLLEHLNIALVFLIHGSARTSCYLKAAAVIFEMCQ
jgi:hypothetical protein